MKFIDLFSKIGGFRRGLERNGHECAGHVEIDKYANNSYMAMYELNSCRYGKKDRICREGERLLSRSLEEDKV